jgi:hypothetical protein
MTRKNAHTIPPPFVMTKRNEISQEKMDQIRPIKMEIDKQRHRKRASQQRRMNQEAVSKAKAADRLKIKLDDSERPGDTWMQERENLEGELARMRVKFQEADLEAKAADRNEKDFRMPIVRIQGGGSVQPRTTRDVIGQKMWEDVAFDDEQKATLLLPWLPLEARLKFERATRGVGLGYALCNSIVLTGSSDYKIQATTVQQYLDEHWAVTGTNLLTVLRALVDDGIRSSRGERLPSASISILTAYRYQAPSAVTRNFTPPSIALNGFFQSLSQHRDPSL